MWIQETMTQNYRMALYFWTVVVGMALFFAPFSRVNAASHTLTLLEGVANSYKVSQAFTQLQSDPNASDLALHYFNEEDLAGNAIDPDVIARSRVIIVNDMYKSLTDYVLTHVDLKTTKVYGLSTVDTEPGTIIADPKVKQYARPMTQKNLTSLIRFLGHRDFGLDLAVEPPQRIPRIGIFHPHSDRIFDTYTEYLTWYQGAGRHHKNGFWIGIPEMISYVYPGESGEVVTRLVEKLESQGMNVLPVYSYPAARAVAQYFWDDKEQKSRVDLVTSLAFKFSPANVDETRRLMAKLDVPFLNPFRVHFLTVDEWRSDVQGLGPMEVTYAMSNPEYFGLIEPTVVGGKIRHDNEVIGKPTYTYAGIEENLDFFVSRVKAWLNLKSTPNKDKKIVIMFWNHTPGKQNIGATYLNVFKSLEKVFARLRQEGYHMDGRLPSEKQIQDLILSTGRNIGSWAPGELDAMMQQDQVVRLPFDRYRQWYEALDPEYRRQVEADWGPLETSSIMVKDNAFILPCIRLGNVVLAPQPSRGWHDDPTKLYHSTTLWPHHQYTAFYLWLKNGFRADALISLGTHGSHEWLPGKQAGLSQSCSPEVLIGDLPNLYPYVMDNIGEGTQAKRRGRGVIIDYLVPAMKKAGVYGQYVELSGLISEYETARDRSPELAARKLDRIEILVRDLGLLRDLGLSRFDEDALETVEHYVLEIGEESLPYGLHTYGVSPEGQALDDFARLIVERNNTLDIEKVKQDLSRCSREMDHLISGLSAGFVPAKSANDPLRNPDAIPTGNNFFGFDPARVPSKDAWALGRDQAEQMIEKYRAEHDGKFPEKIALVFWSIELQRNEGTQVATALSLLGMTPVWDKNGKVTGIEPIPGKVLGRPRIDVHMQVSGLFRDNFPNLILLLDEAVQTAGQLEDVDNFIALHNEQIKTRLLEKGYGETQADRFKQLRVFSNAPGAYGNTIEDLIPASGTWETDEEIADVFINYVSFAYGKDVWGKPLKSAYKENLADVKMTMHTRSSNVFKSLDTDGVFSELGGLALAVKHVSGVYPDAVLSNQADPDHAYVEDIEKAVGRELRARYLNPEWIRGMKQENYAGAREMNRFTEHLWGWQVVTPFAVNGTQWEQIYEVYIQDKYDLDLKAFFDVHNPWARQSMAARMLEADRKKYWQAPEEIKKDLAKTYALNVMEKGVACCEHTCNNPMLQKYVANIVSLYGLLTPRQLEQFKMTIARAVDRTQEQHEADHAEMREALKKTSEKNQQEEKLEAEDKPEKIQGYEMVEETAEDTQMTSSGASWMVMAIVALVLALVAFGWKGRRV
jgi:cobaltochelatase CobN